MKKLGYALLSFASLFVLPVIILCGQIIYNVATYDSQIVYNTTTNETYNYTGWDASKDERKALLIMLSISGCLAISGIMIIGHHEKNTNKNSRG